MQSQRKSFQKNAVAIFLTGIQKAAGVDNFSVSIKCPTAFRNPVKWALKVFGKSLFLYVLVALGKSADI